MREGPEEIERRAAEGEEGTEGEAPERIGEVEEVSRGVGAEMRRGEEGVELEGVLVLLVDKRLLGGGVCVCVCVCAVVAAAAAVPAGNGMETANSPSF